MKIARCPKVRAAINGSSSRYFYHFVLDNCAASLYAEYIMSEASPGDDPMARHNFVCLKTSAFAPYCVKPIRNSGSRALASLPIICTPWHLDVIHVRRSHPTHLCKSRSLGHITYNQPCTGYFLLILAFRSSICFLTFSSASRSFSSSGSAQGWVTRHVILPLRCGSEYAPGSYKE